MSGTQGTQDFIDAAVASLKQGEHPFVLVALQDRQPDGTRIFSIRSGCYDAKDKEALLDLFPQAEQIVRENDAS